MEGKIKGLIVILVAAAIGVNIYVWSLTAQSSTFSPVNLNPSPAVVLNRSPIESAPTSTITTCDTFQSRFGATTAELQTYINDQPETAAVLKGYRNIYGTILAILARDNFPLIFRLDQNGRVTAIECTSSTETRDYTQDLDFTLPENDFAQIIRYRETLETREAPTLLQNLTTKPESAKLILLERLQNTN